MRNADSPPYVVDDDWDPLGKAFWLRELRAAYAESLGSDWSAVTTGMRERQAVWLAAYARTGGKLMACAVAQVTRNTSAKWEREDPIFAGMVPSAKEALADRCAAEIVRRGVEGISISVRDKRGDVIGEERKYSDALLIQLTKNRQDPEARWAQKTDKSGVSEERWRQVFAKIKDDPAMLAALDLIADAAVGGPES